jgi:riboflavin-specific deaminase-like protein
MFFLRVNTLFLFLLNFQNLQNAFVASFNNKVVFSSSISLLQASSSSSEDVKIKGVTLKIAFDSQWGVTDLSEEKSERFTCGESLDMVHRLRRCSDAVLVGRSTLEADDCTLTVRRVNLLKNQSQPTRVIVDPTLQVKRDLRKYALSQDGMKTLIVHAHPTLQQTTSSEFESITFVGIPADENNKLSTKDICEVLAQDHGIHHVMVEGGPATARQFLEEGMVDRAILVYAPLFFKEPLPSNMSPSTFEKAGLDLIESTTLGVDTVDYWSRPGKAWPSDPPPSWP